MSFSGKLVDIRGGELIWRSSMSRTDSGSFACELVFAESLQVISP